MVAVVIDGHAVAGRIIERAAQTLRALPQKRTVLATVLVGTHKQSRLYVNLKMKSAVRAGLTPRLVDLPETTTQDKLHAVLRSLSNDPLVGGILLQLPVPGHLDAKSAMEEITPDKDVDGLTRFSLGALVRNQPGFVPCTPLGVIRILEHYAIPSCRKRAVVIGRSYLTGLPQMLLLARKGVDATVTLCHSLTDELAAATRQADILVSATGVAGLIGTQHVKPGAAVIDAGISCTAEGIRGDVDFSAVREVAGWITPMPGGTGPVTVACLIENTVLAASGMADTRYMQGQCMSDKK